MHIRPAAAVLVTGLALSLGTTLGTAVNAAPGDADDRADRKAAKVAERALDRIEASLAGDGTASRDLSSAYRDLFVHRSALRGDDLATARSLLARPTTPPDDAEDPRDIYYGEDADVQSTCGGGLCLHWVEEGEHAATAEYAADVFATLQQVSTQYAAAGLKQPLPDEGEEGSTQTDFYLGELEEVGALGFCRSDAATPTVGSAYAVFCGIDNDFEFYGGWSGMMQVTVAHEYFHAVQYAYDAEDAGWIYESTAAWVEDEVFDDVNDSAFFLNFGQQGDPAGYPFAGPSMPLDVMDDFGGFNTYGNWGFWRFLTERHAEEEAGIPTLVRDFFRALDTTQGPNPTTAREALDAVLAARGDTTADAYAGFAAANQHPADVYEEGATYPVAPDRSDAVELTRSGPTAERATDLDHLTSASGTVAPFTGSKRLKVRVERGFADLRTLVTVHRTDGTWSTVPVAVNKQGKGAVTVPFGAQVSSVEVTSANGGTLDGQPTSLRFQAVG